MKQMMIRITLSLLVGAAMLSGCGSNSSAAASAPESVKEAASSVASSTESVVPESSISIAEAVESTPEAASEAASIAERPTFSTSEALPTTITATNGGMSIHAPASWSALTGQLDPTGSIDQEFPLTAGNPTVPAYLIANMESKTETSLASFDEYVSTLTRGVTGDERFANTQIVLSEVPFEMNTEGLEARKTKFKALYANNGNPVEIVYWIYAVNGTAGYYQFNCWTLPSAEATEEAVFDAVAASMTEAA